MKPNGDKCHLLFTTEKSISINIDGSNVTSKKEQKVLMEAFITSQFRYFPLIWMLLSWTLSNRIHNIHERALRLTYKDNKSSFKQLLEKDHSVTVPHKNLQVLVTEIFKVKSSLGPDFMKDVFELKEPQYNLRS